MSAWCLLPEYVSKLEKALIEQKDPSVLTKMDSVERRDWLAKYVGADNAKEVNALFESKLLLKNQITGLESFIKRTLQGPPEIKRDLISRVQKLDKVLSEREIDEYLQDLSSKTVGFDIPEEQMKALVDLTKKSDELKTKASPEGKFASKDDRLDYGYAQVNLEKYIDELKVNARKTSFKEQKVKYVAEKAGGIPGVLKSLLSSLDNSFFGRQGIKTLLDPTTTGIWLKDFAKSFIDIGKEIKSGNAMDAIKADIYSRPNSLNGKYKAGDFGLHVLSEEAFPSSLPSRIPLFGRLYKASEVAFNGGALRMRADLADRFIDMAEKNGVNMSNASEAKGLGRLVSSLTGRGSLGKGEVLAKEANILLFSIKFLKANFDTLVAPLKYVGQKAGILGKPATKGAEFASKEAAKSTLRIISTISAALGIAYALNPNSVDLDPRSSNFGKINMFGRWVDITGGMGAMTTLAARLVPTQHNGKWGFWQKNQNGIYVDLTGGKYGQQNALDMFENFFEGKASPALRIVFDLWKGRNYQGEKPTIENVAKGTSLPISFQQFQQMQKDPQASNLLASMILEGVGFSSSPQAYPTNWNSSTSKEMEQLKAKIGQDRFNQANDRFNQKYNEWLQSTIKSEDYKKKTDEEKQDLISKEKEKIKQEIFKSYNFKPQRETKTKSGSLFK